MIMRILLFALSVFLILSCCRDEEANPCLNMERPVADFRIMEVVGDTVFQADTVYRDNPIMFESGDYSSVSWKVGDDARVFTQNQFVLYFTDVLATLQVRFRGSRNPLTSCFPDDDGFDEGIKHITILEQFDRERLTLSPIMGRYRGYFTDAPKDTFTIKVEYFDDEKYNTSVTGTKNFYWISNIPNGYQDNTSSFSIRYPELRNGMPMDMGYKGFVFGWGGASCESGNGWLSQDTVRINYGGPQQCKRKFIGVKY